MFFLYLFYTIEYDGLANHHTF